MNVRDLADGVAEGVLAGFLLINLLPGLSSRPTNRECVHSPVPANKDFSPEKR
jgi:hypothetical protein